MTLKCKIGFHSWNGGKCSICRKIQPLKPLSGTLIILTGPGSKSEKKMTFSTMRIKNLSAKIIICKDSSDFKHKIAKYQNSNYLNVQLWYYLKVHPNGTLGMKKWMEESYFNSLNNAVKNLDKTSKLKIEPIIWGDGSGSLLFLWNKVSLKEIIDHFSAIDFAYSKSIWR